MWVSIDIVQICEREIAKVNLKLKLKPAHKVHSVGNFNIHIQKRLL